MLRRLLCLSVLLVASSAAFGQAVATALRGANLEAGGQFDIVKPDYGIKYAFGGGAVVDVTARKWYGIEAEGNFVVRGDPFYVHEHTILIGPRLVYVHDRLIPYAKVMIGLGSVTLPVAGHPSNTYGAYVFGGGLDWRWKRNITVRAVDFEYQTWPSFGNANNLIYRAGSLTPYQLSFGVKYRFFQ